MVAVYALDKLREEKLNLYNMWIVPYRQLLKQKLGMQHSIKFQNIIYKK